MAVRALTLPVGTDCYALPLASARDVVVDPHVRRLPGARPPILGLFNLRGDIIPVLDTATLLELGSVDSVRFAAIVDTGVGFAALAATGQPEPVELEEPVAAGEVTGVSASYAIGHRIVALLDVDALLVPAHIGRGAI
jgi:purine-binding chemotaxis protein CheW